MVTEHPEDGRAWAAGHAAWSDFAGGVVRSLRDSFEALTAIQFAAPWRNEPAMVSRCEPTNG